MCLGLHLSDHCYRRRPHAADAVFMTNNIAIVAATRVNVYLGRVSSPWRCCSSPQR
jgi:hypothetical protein